MATLTAPRFGSAQSWGSAGMVKALDSGDVAVSTADIALNGLIKLFTAPKGFVVTGAVLTSTDIDTNGTPLVTLALGDIADDDRYVTGATIGRTGGTTATLASTGVGYLFTADTDIYIKVTAAAATAAAGTVRGALIGYAQAVYG